MEEIFVNLEITNKNLGEGGEGGEAVVFTAQLDGKLVVVKKLSKRKAEFERVTREASKLRRLRHGKHITYIYGTTWEDKSLYIVMKYCEHKDLQSYLRKNEGSVTDEQKILFCRGILLGLLHCHSMKIFHGDIKCKNVIIGENLEPQLADFGFSISVDSIKYYEKPTYRTVHWVAPEIFSIQEDQVYLKFIADPYPCDVYSLGATFCEISYDGTTDFITSDEPDIDIMYGYVSPTPKDAFLQEIVDGCCQFERNERISLDECLSLLDNVAEKQLLVHTVDDAWKCIQKSIDPKQKQEYPLTFILHRPKKNLVLGPSNLSLLEWLCINDCRDAVDYMLQKHSLEQGQVKWLYGISRLCGSMVVAKFIYDKLEDMPNFRSETDIYQVYLDSDLGRSFCSSYSGIRNTLSLSELMYKNPQQFIESLVNAGADFKSNSSLLRKAVEMHYNRIVRIFVESKPNAKNRIAYNAVKATNVKIAKVLSGARFDLEGWDKSNGDTPLLTAINAENIEAVRIILSSGADVHKRNKHIENGVEVGNQHTPLYRAALSGNPDIVRLLIVAGATIDTESKEWQSLVQDLESRGESTMVQFIVDTMKESPQNPAVKVTPLCSAIRDGQKNNARGLIDDGVDVDEHDYDGYAPLHLAVLSSDKEIIETLIGAGAYIDIKTQSSKQILRPTSSLEYFGEYTPLHIAVVKKNFYIAQLLIESGANFSKKNGLGQTAIDLAGNENRAKVEGIIKDLTPVTADLLRWAVKSTSVETVKALILKIHKKRITGTALSSLLDIAGKHGKTETVEFLINKGAKFNSEYKSKSPLEWAIFGGHVQIIKILINAGASINAKSINNDATLLHIAAAAGHKDIVELFIHVGIDIDEKDKKGHTPLLYAAINGHEETVDLLRSKGSNAKLWEKAEEIDAMYKMAKQIVYKAAETGKLVVVKTFIESGVEVDFENEDGNTPLVAAIQSGRRKAVQYLLDKGANPNKQSSKTTPLIAAIIGNQIEVVKTLLTVVDGGGGDNDDGNSGDGLNPNMRDQKGYLPILEAVKIGNVEVIQLLIDHGADPKRKGKCFYNSN